MNCPLCGAKLTIKSKPGEPGRVQGFCTCHPEGSVIETNTPPKRGKKEIK